MREPQQDLSSEQYERPNQPWVCGLAAEGQACAIGPTGVGGCPAVGECAPVREGDRWRCNRSALRGGACDKGPTPEGRCGRVLRCQPVRSLRARRGRFVTACAVFTTGVLVIAMSADWRDTVIAPGPLARQHAQLMERGGAANCAACHSAAERSVGGWAAAMVVGHGDRPTQSELCMKCHEQSIARELTLAAHNLPFDRLLEITRSHGGTPRGNDEFACATCHREHYGADFDLTAIDNERCQACHQRRYLSFAVDHPDFGVWPYERRTRIAFNHASHQSKHFAEKKQRFDCQQCHVEDATRDVELTASYETACATCHDEKIATSVSRGVPMLILPMLDVDALRAAGHEIGAWPAAATGDFDGRLPPPMKMLLAADPTAAKAMATLGADFEFLDIDPADAKQLAACADLAAAIKKMLADVSQRGPAAVRERVAAALGREVTDSQLGALVAGLSVDTVRGGVTEWFAGVDAGNAPWLEGSKSAGLADHRRAMVPVEPPDLSYGPAGAWFRDDATLTIRYRPVTHADPVLTSWLELLAATPELESRPLELAIFKELAKPTAAGLCTTCHSVERAAAGELVVNWQGELSGKRRTAILDEPPTRGFTKFSHRPHLLLPELADCAACHAIDELAATATSYADWNPHAFVSDFRAISKRQCAQCHTATAAGDACQSCHNYHVDRLESWRVGSAMEDAPMIRTDARSGPASVARRLNNSAKNERR